MRTSSTVPNESVAITEAKPTMSNRLGAIPKTKSPVRYSPVYKQPDQNHIEELNFRLKSINDRIHIKLTETDGSSGDVLGAQALRGDDINPSVGSDTEKELDINIQHLESTVSSLSPMPSSNSTAFNSPDAAINRRNHNKNWHAERYETDF